MSSSISLKSCAVAPGLIFSGSSFGFLGMANPAFLIFWRMGNPQGLESKSQSGICVSFVLVFKDPCSQ